jgi:uncharacterized FlgJ-related protein
MPDDYTHDELRLYRDGLWDERGWAEDYVEFISAQDSDTIASELRTLLTYLSYRELREIRAMFEDYYQDGVIP